MTVKWIWKEKRNVIETHIPEYEGEKVISTNKTYARKGKKWEEGYIWEQKNYIPYKMRNGNIELSEEKTKKNKENRDGIRQYKEIAQKGHEEWKWILQPSRPTIF